MGSVFGTVALTPAPVMSTARPAFPPLSLTRSTDRRGARVIFLIGCTQGRGVGCYLVSHSRTLTTGKTDSTPNAWCVAPPPRPSGDLLLAGFDIREGAVPRCNKRGCQDYIKGEKKRKLKEA